MRGELACCGISKKVDAITDFWKIFLDAPVFGYILTPLFRQLFPTFSLRPVTK
jgi:hypothetical protein